MGLQLVMGGPMGTPIAGWFYKGKSHLEIWSASLEMTGYDWNAILTGYAIALLEVKQMHMLQMDRIG